MDFIFCEINNSDNTINKSFSNDLTINLNLRKDFNLMSSELLVKSESDLGSYNYIRVSELGRNYFIESITQISGNLYKVEITCDVLESFKLDILNSNCRFYRNIKDGDYQNVKLDSSNESVISSFSSNVSIEDESSTILSTIGVKL